MKEKTSNSIIFLFTIIYLILFSINALLGNNYEFLYYTAIISASIIIILIYNKAMKLRSTILFGLSIVGMMHILGGNVIINNVALYSLEIIFGITYGNLVHLASAFVCAFIAYNLLLHNIYDASKNNKLFLFLIITAITLGIGGFIEIIKLIAYILLKETAKSYLIFGKTLFFNMLGAIIASTIIINYRYKPKRFLERKEQEIEIYGKTKAKDIKKDKPLIVNGRKRRK